MKFKIHRIGEYVLHKGKSIKTNIYRDSQYNFYVHIKGKWYHARSVTMHKDIYGYTWITDKEIK